MAFTNTKPFEVCAILELVYICTKCIATGNCCYSHDLTMNIHGGTVNIILAYYS